MAIRTFAAALIVAAAGVSCGASSDDATGDGRLPTRLASESPASSDAPPTSEQPSTTSSAALGSSADDDAAPRPGEAATIDDAAAVDPVADPAADTATAGRVVEVVGPADVIETAERRDDGVVIAWIGGSDVVWKERSLPAAIAALTPRIGHRPTTFRPVTDIGPTPDEIAGMVTAQAAEGVDGLVVAMNVSWAAWGGTDRCASVEAGYQRYACILEPVSGSELAERRAAMDRLVDAIAATDLPSYVYVIAHSRQAMSDPALADRIDAAEAFIASFDPGLSRIEWEPTILTRGVEGADEGTVFRDMVHPTDAGVVFLAELLAPRFDAFFAEPLG